MRCAFQAAVASCLPETVSSDCPDCVQRWNSFYSGRPDKAPPDDGRVTATCLGANGCWFSVGCKKHVPKDKCLHVGHYCGCYVWVTPEGRDELTKLTLTILDYAVNEPATTLPSTKEVEVYLDHKGLPTTSENAVAKAKAVIAMEDPIDVLWRPTALSRWERRAQAQGVTVDDLLNSAPRSAFAQEMDAQIRSLETELGVDLRGKEITRAQLERIRAAIGPTPIVIPSRPTPVEAPSLLEMQNLLQTVR
jgi:hypothetical protein